jgi:hypothetical protein
MIAKIKLDRSFWRKSLISIFVGLIVCGSIMLVSNYMGYQKASLQLESLNTNSIEQPNQENLIILKRIQESRQRRHYEDGKSDAMAIMLGLVGIIFVERKTRKQ